jgi:hypothetical protein
MIFEEAGEDIKVWSETENPLKNLTVFCNSRPGFCVYRNRNQLMAVSLSFDDAGEEAYSEEEEEEEEATNSQRNNSRECHLYGVAGESQGGSAMVNKKWQTIAIMSELASVLTIHQLKLGNVVHSVTIIGLSPNYLQNSTKVYKFEIDFQKGRSLCLESEEELILSDGLAQALNWLLSKD